MSKIRILPIDFDHQAGMFQPRDARLFQEVQEFAKRELVQKPVFGSYAKCWAAVRLGNEGQIEEVLGIAGIRQIIDIPLFRSVDSGATLKLSQRINDHLADAGLREQEVMLYVDGSEQPERRCEGYGEALNVWNAVPANRQIIVVR